VNPLSLFRPITTFVFDVDGVLTNGSLILSEDGGMLRTMNIRDGYAMQWAIKKGYDVWVVSGARSEAVRSRLTALGVSEVHIGVQEKVPVLEALFARTGADPQAALYMGDDLPDYEVMQHVALPCCPADAATEIKAVSRYISHASGGAGCVRDVIEKTLKLRGDWAVQTAPVAAF